jgi:hypothetical protein
MAIMNIDIDAFAKILGPVLSLVAGALVKHYTEAKSKVVSFLGHASSFTLQGPQLTTIHTHSVIVRNAGRKVASNVRLTHAELPLNVTIYPPVQHSIQRNADGSGDILIPALVPKEQITISYLYFPPLVWSQIHINTKSDEGFAKIINVIPMPQPNLAITIGVWILMFVGASFLFYWLVRTIATTI